MRPTESSLGLRGERPKLATRRKFLGDRGLEGLKVHPKQSETILERLIPRSKLRSERPAMSRDAAGRRTGEGHHDRRWDWLGVKEVGGRLPAERKAAVVVAEGREGRQRRRLILETIAM